MRDVNIEWRREMVSARTAWWVRIAALFSIVLASLSRAAAADVGRGDWPEFRGPARDGAVHGVTIRTDWQERPPTLVWKRPIGAGWSSIAVVGDRLVTQEQRGENEAVAAFDAATGDELWVHEDNARFEEQMGGVGPRATPTVAGGKVFALGATGLLNCLDATTGERRWSRNIAEEGQGKVPYWAFSGSPLVVGDKVIVFAGGGADPREPGEELPIEPATQSAADHDKALLAYEVESGELAWQAAAGSNSYSSPQLATIDGTPQALFMSDAGLLAFDPATGELLWRLESNARQALPMLQPHMLGGPELLASFSGQAGLLRAAVERVRGVWQVREQSENWTPRDIKPLFSAFVQSGDAIYGIDGKLLCCIDAKTGKRRWKKGRYGSGQILLVADQPVLLVISEAGEVALVECNPDEYAELGRFQAIEGKTWNHPTIARGKLFVRNAQEMACYEL